MNIMRIISTSNYGIYYAWEWMGSEVINRLSLKN